MKKIAFVAVALAVSPLALHAVVRLPHVFGDKMVLQCGQKVPVWGKADPGERVTVSFAGQTVSATADAKGAWRIDLKPLKASATGAAFRVKGTNEIVFRNVLVGEVWFCSGQSNMEYTMSARRKVKDWEREVAAAKWPLIRHFHPPHRVAYEPMDDLEASWVETTPETIPPQSAVAFFFGETLHKELNVPVGLINCSWGGSRIEPWTPAGHPDDLWLLQNIGSYSRAFDTPTVLWNGMVAGLVPYAIKGAIWYQGCANRADGAKYIDKTVSLVRGWRREWGQGDFPYFLIQLAPYKYSSAKGTELPVFQEAQARIPEKVANSGCTVINDVGDVNDIHPTDKRTVGMRLADQVLDRVYERFVRPWRTPTLKSSCMEGKAFRVTLADADGLKTRDGLPPTCFELRDAAGVWMPADAKIEGSDVVLTADGIEQPIAMRFAAYNGSTPNLVNGAGLPVGPFHCGAKMKIGDAENLPELKGMTCVQRYDIPKEADFSRKPPVTLASREGVSRVAYLLEVQAADGEVKFVMAAMDAFAANSDDLVLTAKPGARLYRKPVANLTVRTNSSNVKALTDAASGFVEFYNCNYSSRCRETPAGGETTKYDFNDSPQPQATLGYGCLQIHDVAAKATVLAFNRFNNPSQPCDIGIGSNPDGRGNPDWTFAANAGLYEVRRISVWVK